MNWWAIFGAGLLAGATTCAVTQGGLLVGLIARQKKAAAEAAPPPPMKGKGKGKAKTATPAPRPVNPADDLIPVTGFLLGKLVILTFAGLLLGGLGSLVAFNAHIGATAQLVAGVMMVVLGLSIAGVPWFREVVFAPPASWTRVVRKSTRSQSAFAPFLLGVATLLIPCGVTISMLLLAATSGSPVKGAGVMAVFVLGTAPMFATYGYVTQRFVKPDSRRMPIILGSIVVAMGVFTFNGFLVASASPVTAQSVAASLFGQPAAAAEPAAPAPAVDTSGVQVLRIDATSGGYSPRSIAARSGVPTKLVIHTDNTRSCIVLTVLPSMGKQVMLPSSGDTEVDLGTLSPGRIPISCSMGMYTATISVS